MNYNLRPKTSPMPSGRCRCMVHCWPTKCDNAALKQDCNNDNCGSDYSCGNRAFVKNMRLSGKRLKKRLESRATKRTGNGLFTRQKLTQGDVVCVYDGKILSTAQYEKQKRMGICSNKIAKLPDGRYVDAAYKNRVGGFVNHACQPNCVLTCRKIGEIEHLFIVALLDIENDKELYINYSGGRKNYKPPFSCKCDTCILLPAAK